MASEQPCPNCGYCSTGEGYWYGKVYHGIVPTEKEKWISDFHDGVYVLEYCVGEKVEFNPGTGDWFILTPNYSHPDWAMGAIKSFDEYRRPIIAAISKIHTITHTGEAERIYVKCSNLPQSWVGNVVYYNPKTGAFGKKKKYGLDGVGVVESVDDQYVRILIHGPSGVEKVKDPDEVAMHSIQASAVESWMKTAEKYEAAKELEKAAQAQVVKDESGNSNHGYIGGTGLYMPPSEKSNFTVAHNFGPGKAPVADIKKPRKKKHKHDHSPVEEGERAIESWG